ncbi:MAG: AAA family ATPase [Planctomycetota bacterium]
MKKEYSPFTPGLPVPLEFFVGRTREIQNIVASTRKAFELKTIERLFITGERGIGKSSLGKAALTVAERDLGALGLHVFLGGVDTPEEMVRRIFEKLLRESAEKPWHSKIKEFLGNHVRQLDIFGLTVEFSASRDVLERAVSDFLPALKNLLKKIGGEKRGVLLMLDDLNGLATSARFANWLKSMVDELAVSRQQIPISLVLIGLPERRRQLIERQPSLDRVFDVIEIRRFSEQETKEFFHRAFSQVGVSVQPEAHAHLWRLSGGYPVFLHELGDAIFDVDQDGLIDPSDALGGSFHAAEEIGRKYIEPKVLAAIRSEHYQQILRKIAKRPFEHRFTRKDAAAGLTPDEAKVFDNFLRRMEKLSVIRKDKEHGPGSYEFTSELLYQFFWLQAGTK